MNPVYLLTVRPLLALSLMCSQLTAPATITCRLNIELWTVNSNVGLNLSVFDAATSLEQAETPNTQPTEKKDGDVSPPSPSPSTPSFTGRMLPSCTPSSALFSTNNGIYVIRPSGPSLQAIELPSGMFIFVPSTFDPTPRKYILDFYILSSLGMGTGFTLTRLR